MRTHLLTASLALTFIATSALAQTSSYYIVQDTTTKKCTVTTQRPTTTTSVVIGDGKVYTSQTEAEGALKTVKVCETK